MVLTAATRAKRPRSVMIIVFIISLTAVTSLSTSSMVSFIFGGCSQLKYSPGSTYESNVNSMLTSFVNSAAMSSYNNFTIANSFVQTTSSSKDKVYGLYQCRGDLTPPDCAACVSRAVSQVGLLCIDAAGAALQLGGCFVKYDNSTFLGAEDKTVLFQKCGPPGFDSGELTQRDSLLSFLAGTGGYFRVGSLGRLQGLAQCVGDLSVGQCQDCISDAIGRLRNECGTAYWGDMYLGKCYVRFADGGGDHSRGHAGRNVDTNSNDDEIEKTLAILIGLIAGVALLVVFISVLSKVCEKKVGK